MQKKITQVSFSDLHSAVVYSWSYIPDIVRSCERQNGPCVMVQRFYRPILSGNKTTPTKVGQLYWSTDVSFTTYA